MTATPKGSKGSLGRGERANLTIEGQLRAFREAVSVKYKAEIGPDHVLMGWMVRHCAWVVNHFQVKSTGRTLCRSIRGQGLHWRSCAIWRSVLGAKSLGRWSQVEYEVDAKSFCRQA